MDSDLVTRVLSGVPIPLVLIGRDERIKQMNPFAETMFGSNMVGRHFFSVLRQPDILDAITNVYDLGTAHETRFSEKSHVQETIYRVICAPVDSDQGKGVLVSFTDVTPEETAGQMRRDFVANVSHELKTPLTALLGFIETLKGPARSDPAARDRFLETMQKEAERMNRLVSDLLSLSRVETDERVRPTEPQNLSELVESVCRSLRPLADDAKVTLEAMKPDDTIVVRGDADQLMQVFTNLIENALKYGAEGGKVSISYLHLAKDPVLRTEAVQVEIRDFGPGIDSIHLHRLTERFYRADSHRSRELGGTGLGLAIVKHILNRHRGRLRIDSELGVGSRFSVILPLPDAQKWM